MRFQRLRLSGFKSFVQPTELLIQPGLTGIVGPNGCGKSNLVEALRWVMGETSAKGLRGGDMEDVIFAGTASRPAFDLAEVSLELVTRDPVALAGDGEEIELSRRIARGAGSAYRLNGREIRAREVQLLFADAASGARSASIVSQGQIGQLVEAKPVERRRLLEDAAGVAGLQARRHEAELKLQAAEANLMRLDDRLGAWSDQRERLARQARQAERYKALGLKIRAGESRLLKGRWVRAKAACETVAAERDEAIGIVAKLTEAVALSKDEMSRLAFEKEEEGAAKAALATERARIGERLAAGREAAQALGERREGLARDRERTCGDLDAALAAADDAGKTAARVFSDMQTCQQSIADLDVQAQALAGDRDRLEQDAAEAEDDFRRCLSELSDLTTALSRLDADTQQERERRGALVKTLKAIRARLQSAGRPIDRERADSAAAERSLDEAQEAARHAESDLAAADAVMTEAVSSCDDAESKRDTLRAQLEAVEADVARALENQKDLTTRVTEVRASLTNLDTRRESLLQRHSKHRAAWDEIDLDSLTSACEEAACAVANGVTDVEARRADEAALLPRLEAARQRAVDVTNRLAGVVAEAAALRDIAESGSDHPPVLNDVRPQAGYADALASALGDDLLASLDPEAPVHWDMSSAAPELQPLPEGCKSLATVVEAPPALRVRLSQVGVADITQAEALAQRLRPGQRLVTCEGALWRWDGYRRTDVALPPAAVRLRQSERLRHLDQSCTELEAETAASAQDLDGLETRLGELQRAREAAETALDAAEERRMTALKSEEEARAARLRLDEQLEGLAEDLAHIDAERETLVARSQDIGAKLEAAANASDRPDAAVLTGLLEEAERTVSLAREAATEAARSRDEVGERVRRGQNAVDEARRRLDEAFRAERDALARERDQEIARAEARSELERLQAELAALDASAGARAEAHFDLERRLSAIRGARPEAEDVLNRARAAVRETDALWNRKHERLSADRNQLEHLRQQLPAWRQRAAEAAERAESLRARLTDLDQEMQTLADQSEAGSQLDDLECRAASLEDEHTSAVTMVQHLTAAHGAASLRYDEASLSLGRARERAAHLEASLEHAVIEARKSEEAWRALEIHDPADPSEPAPAAELLRDLATELEKLQAARERMGPVNLRAADELAELESNLQTLSAERAEVQGAIEHLRRAISTLNREGRERLSAAFGEVESHFGALFTRLFGGGYARLALTDLDDPLAAGLDVMASPPGKKLQSLSLLSGGEKALTALALAFAVFLTRPSPLCILDEVDAPLDDANVARLASLLDELGQSTETRFLIVTHHPLTMAHMDRLYGVTMLEQGVSQLVSVALNTAIAMRASA